MPPHVFFAVDCGPEALLTERTFVRLQAHVCRHVPGEAAVGSERSVANTAAERLHSCDNGNEEKHVFCYLRLVSSQSQQRYVQ